MNECTLSTRKLFTQIQSKLIINPKENECLCPKCKGLRFYLIETNTETYIESCRRCHTGILDVCKHCGTANKSFCQCKEASNERSVEYHSKHDKKTRERFLQATKINFKDYDGKFLLDGEDHVKDSDDIEEWIYEELHDGEYLLPDYLWATKASPVFSIDIREVISDKCEDGYDDMYSHLDTDSQLLTQAQGLISQWEQEQGESLYIYDEDYTRAIMLKGIINEISDEIRKEK